MSLKIRAIIDGDTYSECQLDNIQYEREKKTLQTGCCIPSDNFCENQMTDKK